LAHLDGLLAAGKQDEALAFLYEGLVGLNKSEAQQLIATRGAMLRPLLPGSRLDIEAMISVDPDPAHWSMIKLPTLLLSGDHSVRHPLQDSVAELASVLPDSQTFTLTGQGHEAYSAAPDMLAGAVGEFFQRQTRRSA
jgi:pimeloyl-ACP methyl ester carboxylesterase